MQTGDARKQRAHIESKGLGGGGVIPELDSHEATPANPEPVTSRFAPWHACGPDYASYSKGNEAYCRPASGRCHLPSSTGRRGHRRRIEAVGGETFGIPGDPGHLQFTNARMRFLPGMEGKSEGFTDVSIAVRGEERHKGIFDRAREVGLPSGDGWVEMLGCRWHFVSASGTREDVSKL
ncbi:hypothetical protein, variant [Blastomyces dermatitidis ATCC 18188]|uniref:Uncharacterized protein n=1 Tax=Ajellomyces dermatitidis (strain ATCC 18188 / CBS 674.68) TaxID=653446 RepID=F2T6V5_AJEDA|nr:hypothetical protein BDDG_01856 [Blastomyces dermatitidis ATCC 18188]KMW66843.1 hypothetical protein, variant [Blastomyces dermatitidis ATCC 18188]